MSPVDLRPFGFTPTESLVYTALLELGPSTGYAVARAARLARANAYAALEGLVTRRAAGRAPGRPARYPPVDPQTLPIHPAAHPGRAPASCSPRPARSTPRAPSGARTRCSSSSRAPPCAPPDEPVARARPRVVGRLQCDAPARGGPLPRQHPLHRALRRDRRR